LNITRSRLAHALVCALLSRAAAAESAFVGPPEPATRVMATAPAAVASPCPRSSKLWTLPVGLAAGTAVGVALGNGSGSGPAPRMRSFGTADAILTAASYGYVVVDNLRKGEPAACRWCDQDGGQITLNALDRSVRDGLRWQDRDAADRASDVLLFASAAAPLATAAASGQTASLNDAGLVLEAAGVSMALTELSKKFFRRPRPYALNGGLPCGTDRDASQSGLSFFSGHSATTFALAVSSGTIALERDRRNAGWVLGTGLAMAATTGYLRIAAERHYFTDVVVGAAVGSLTGFLVPHLHRPTAQPSPVTPPAGTLPNPSGMVPAFTYARGVGDAGGLLVRGGLSSGGPGLSVSWLW